MEKLIKFYLRILLAKLGPLKLCQVIFKPKNGQLSSLLYILPGRTTNYGTLYSPPAACLREGILPNQIVRVTFLVNHAFAKSDVIERDLRVRVWNRDKFAVTRLNFFNFFGPGLIENVTVQAIKPLPERLELAQKIKLAKIHQDEQKVKSIQSDELTHLLSSCTVFRTGDVVSVEKFSLVDNSYQPHFYRVDVGSTPKIVDESAAFYQVSAVSRNVPYSAWSPKFRVPKSIVSLSKELASVYLATRQTLTESLVVGCRGPSGCGKRLTARLFAAFTHQNFHELSAYDLNAESSEKAETKVRAMVERVKKLEPCVVFVADSHVLAYDSAVGIDQRVIHALKDVFNTNHQLTFVLSCVSYRANSLHRCLKDLEFRTVTIPAMDENDRTKILKSFLPDDVVVGVVRQTLGFTISEMVQLCANAKIHARSEKVDVVTEQHIQKAIDARNSNFAGAIGAPKIPNVRWEDVGGMEETKETIVESIRASMYGGKALKRSGIILFGPPGCGKTLIAKAVATEFKIAFLSVKGPELLNKYVGQSEENLRKVFERAKQASPCVVFFDEIDSLAPNRGKNGDSAGVIDRIVSQLLAEMDKLSQSTTSKVFVMGATNRVDLLDPSLLTPGRFDKKIEVKPGSDVDSKASILKAVSRKMTLDDDVDLKEIAAHCPEQVSGAQLYSLISNAAMVAIVERVKLLEAGRTKDQKVAVKRHHLLEALNKINY